MNYAHLLEATMLVCFGFSWPLNVVKAYKARTAKGTSLAFIILSKNNYSHTLLKVKKAFDDKNTFFSY